MEKEVLNMIINKKIKRLTLLLLSTQEGLTFTSEELEKRLNVTKITLKRDLQELKELYPIQLTIEISELITIQVNEDYTILELVKPLLLEDPALIIFFKLISNESLNFFECCKELFISETTLKRYIIVINQYLTRYGIKLSYFPIRFIGSEINIRTFYVHLLESFDYLKIDFQKELILSFCIEFEQKLVKTSMKNLEINFEKFFLWLSTTALRTKMQHFIKLSDINLDIIEKTDLHQLIEEHLKNSYFLQDIPEIEQKFIYLILWGCIENDFSFLFLKQSSELIASLKTNNLFIESMTKELERSFCLTENNANTNNIFHTILYTFFVLKRLSQILPDYYLLHTEINNYLLYYHYDLYKKWQQFINKFPLLFDHSVDIQILGLKYTLLSLIKDWMKLQTYKIAIDLNIPSTYRLLILSTFKESLSVYHMDIQPIQLSPSKLSCLLHPFDLLITNYPLELPPKAPIHFQLCKYPTVQEIEQTIKKIIQLKKQSMHSLRDL
ncbi:helix-turn-helix domain-containing protein [Enterococcus villorum]|uniref:Mga helix-turn-helix domain-containing protein n=1 Tax=Enterococcus villorum TaxID=112904 RepID=A0A511J1Q6_9ENTE|nr:helix-turn-helix domain-containing protein [Enterococcus villorum]GEL91946.1 hypothetical protein EVI01_12830 [Enterococcus villorum]